ncbi:MAG: serine/threonine-protein kinase [Pseudomonadota bacterium]
MGASYRARQLLGKYRIVRRLALGPLAEVYHAYDTVQQLPVALKLPLTVTARIDEVSDFVSEVRIASKLSHPNILSIHNASFIGERFVIAMPLGIESLASRLERRMANAQAVEFCGQALCALAHAHEHNVIHCDIKPENFILFEGQQLRLADFGFAKVSKRTIKGSGSGTIDYIAPEQAMGKPRMASDVFSLGLVFYQMFTGVLPEYPFDWPPSQHARLLSRTNEAFSAMLRKAMDPDPRRRYRDAGVMLAAFLHATSAVRRQKGKGRRPAKNAREPAWRKAQWREFRREYRQHLELKAQCRRCEGPVAMQMQACPWCGTDNPAAGAEPSMPAQCPRCERGVKLDWNYCAWCYGSGFEPETTRRFADKRYIERCSNSACKQPLMAHMRYCPWCRSKVRRRWQMRSNDLACRTCKQPIASDYWRYCAWCREPVSEARPRPRQRDKNN